VARPWDARNGERLRCRCSTAMPEDQKPRRTLWLTVLLPVVAAGVAWLWLEATAGRGCEPTTGGPGDTGLALLVGAVAVAVGAYTWRRRRSATAIAVQVVLSFILATVLVGFTVLVSGGVHGCYS
jgi:peptidoglycan/LPS O-acetylase OafA/YrhL